MAHDVANQIRAGQDGIVGVMLESNLYEGRQDVPVGGTAHLKQGMSITDECIGWASTLEVLYDLAAAVRARRSRAQRQVNGHDA